MVLGGRPPGRVGRRRIFPKTRGPSGPLVASMGKVRTVPARKKWGGVARRGAGNLDPEKRRREQEAARGRGRGRPTSPPPKERREPKELGPPPAWEPEQWIREPDAEGKPIRKAATKAVKRGEKPAKAAAKDR